MGRFDAFDLVNPESVTSIFKFFRHKFATPEWGFDPCVCESSKYSAVVTERTFPTGDVVFERLLVHTSVSSVNGRQPGDRPYFPALCPA